MRDPLSLSRRERQILEILFATGRATAAEILARMPDAPTYTTVRGLLRVLETKGHVRHEEDGPRYVYFPVMAKGRTAKSMLRHVVSTFFDGSPSRAMAALLGSTTEVNDEELGRLAELIDKARKERA
ncbi:MAG TPA: BlaI/MecI/CopY family transcriptional regulator [Thermoanaerobaculia bacterium]|jgi:predicted transcriptional regulator